jgi:hypothetical protein
MSENEPQITGHDGHTDADASSVEAPRPALARGYVDKENETKIRADLDRVFTEHLLAQTDVGESLARDLAAADMTLPTLSEIDQVFNLMQVEAVPSSKEIERLLSLDSIGDITIEGMRLNELLDSGITSLEERKMLKRGILFLKRKMYPEAAEWWLLNRPEDDLTESRFHLLLTLFLALTYKLSGDDEAANSTLLHARSNRLFKKSK